MDVVRIPPDDPIEKLVTESVRLGEEVAIAYRMGFEEKDRESLKEKARESERLWQEAKKLGKNNVTDKNYEDLANAILQRAVEDYEDLMCGTISPGATVNYESILGFLEDQTFVKLDMIEQIERIKRIYHKKFIPYVDAHWKEIKEESKEFDEKKLRNEDRVLMTKHHCPLCGGALKPCQRRGGTAIGCTDCHLVHYIPFKMKEDKRCRKYRILQNTQQSAVN